MLVAEWRNEKFACDFGFHLARNSVAFVAHDDKSVLRKRATVDVVALEESAETVQASLLTIVGDELWQVGVEYVHAQEGAHRSLNDLRVVKVGAAV